jgi:hypothetical protein
MRRSGPGRLIDRLLIVRFLIDVFDKTPRGLVPVVPALLHYPKFGAVS